MKQVKNNKGYALLWAVVVLMFGTIIVAGALHMASSMTERSLGRNQRNQAYYTALSVVDTIAGQLGGNLDDSTPNGAAAIAVLDKLAKDGKVTMSNVTGLPKQMGSCSVEITLKDSKTMLITATARYNDEEYTLTGIMGGTKVEVVNPPSMGTPGLGLGGMGDFASGGNTGNGSFVTDPNTPIYIWNPNDITEFVSTGREIMHMSTLYSKGSLNLKDNYQSTINHVHGEVVCDGDINLFGMFTVGPYKAGCCDNTANSYVYTMGNFRMGERTKVEGNVTATSIDMKSESPVIKGKVFADSITITTQLNNPINNIDGSALASGYTVECNTLTMSGDAMIKGNVRANTITLKEGAHIEGDVEADQITIDGNQVTKGIKGKVKVNRLTMSNGKITGDVVADSITMASGATITGNVTVNDLEGKDWAVINGNVTCNNLDYNGAFNGSWTPTQERIPPPASTDMPFVGPLTSRVPDRTDPPQLTAPEATPELGEGKEVTIADTGKVRVYTVSTNTTIKKLRIMGEQPVLFLVEDGVELIIEEMATPANPNKPNLFIQLGYDSELSIGRDSNAANNKFYLYAWGKPGDECDVNIGRRVQLYGGINVDEVENIHKGDTNNEFHWKDPGDTSWMEDLGAVSGPPVPPDPDNPDNPDAEQEMVWKLGGYAAN